MQNTKEEIEAILVSMGLVNTAFNLPIKKQIDSLDVTALIIAVEDQWDIEISNEEQYGLATFDDLIKLIHMKTIIPEAIDKPTIDEQIRYMEVLEAVGHRPAMIKAIKENLIAVRLMMETSKRIHDIETNHHLQSSTLSGNPPSVKDVEPPFNHPSGHSFTEGHEL